MLGLKLNHVSKMGPWDIRVCNVTTNENTLREELLQIDITAVRNSHP